MQSRPAGSGSAASGGEEAVEGDAGHGGKQQNSAAACRTGAGTAPLQVLPGVRHVVDRASRLIAQLCLHEGPDEHDPLALLAGDPCPVIRIGGIRQVLVLTELIDTRGRQVLRADPLLPSGLTVDT